MTFSMAALLVAEIIGVNIVLSIRGSNSTLKLSQLERFFMVPLV
jgi:hypothetical protein